MRFLKRSRSSKSGLPPGSLVFVGEQKSKKVRLELIEYDEDGCFTKNIKKKQIDDIKKMHRVTWLNVTGIHDVEILESIGRKFDIHPLVLEDILNTNQRPKMDVFDNFMFIVLRMIYPSGNSKKIITEQVSLIIMDGMVISFQEREEDVFNKIRDRICNNKGRIRRMGGDYLAYAMIDSIVDGYFNLLEKISDRVEGLEEQLLDNPSNKGPQNA